jgi:hypothetical protein
VVGGRAGVFQPLKNSQRAAESKRGPAAAVRQGSISRSAPYRPDV